VKWLINRKELLYSPQCLFRSRGGGGDGY